MLTDDKKDSKNGEKNKERLLCLILGLGFALLILVQAGLYCDKIRPTSAWYGLPVDTAAREVAAVDNSQYGLITWELVDLSRLELARLCRNGSTVADFVASEVTLRVYDGDLLSLDTTAYPRPVRVRLKKASAWIDGAFLLQDVESCGEIVELGRIVFE